MNSTREFNLENWSGESVAVDYDDEGNFEFYGYKFQVTGFVDIYNGEGYRSLFGDQWDDNLCILNLKSDDLEAAVISAVRYVANRV